MAPLGTYRERPKDRARKPRQGLARSMPYILIIPATGYLCLFGIVPVVRGLWLSLTDTQLINPQGGSFIGLHNYSRLFQSDAFWHSLYATLVYTGITVLASVGMGTIAALIINRQFRGRSVIRAALTFPWAVPTVAAALIFVWIYNQQNGILNAGLRGLGLGPRGWLTDPSWGMFSVLVATVWKVFPLVMLVVLAALQGVSEDLIEASRIDGADGANTFRAVVLPHILPTVRVVALLMTVWSIRRFEIIYLLTGGGPLNSTDTLVVDVYRKAFEQRDLGPAAAVGGIGLLVAMIITAIYFYAERRREMSEAG